jgi:hypothetical protein
MHYTRNVKGKIVQIKLQKTPNLRAPLSFATETSLVWINVIGEEASRLPAFGGPSAG